MKLLYSLCNVSSVEIREGWHVLSSIEAGYYCLPGTTQTIIWARDAVAISYFPILFRRSFQDSRLIGVRISGPRTESTKVLENYSLLARKIVIGSLDEQFNHPHHIDPRKIQDFIADEIESIRRQGIERLCLQKNKIVYNDWYTVGLLCQK